MIAALRAIITVEANDKASSVIQSIIDLLRSMPSSKTVTVTTVEKKVTEESGETQAKGNAMASGTKTLMGELGPELYVTNGRYYVAGQNGAEFVNLPDDAIVFNHLQTKKLLESGSSGRGHAVTTEERAVAYARGSLGPAAADAR
jgi:CRISPR/Cas system endoribonuclease Cas6 (RAMP superfamily)